MVARETTLRRAEADLGELLQEHRGGVNLSELEGTSIVRFARERLGFEPWEPRQREVLEAVEDRPLVVVQGANAAGKDAAAAVAALWWTFTKGGLVLVTAAVERQLVDVFMGEVRRWWRHAGNLPGQLYRSALRVPGSEHAGIVTFTSTEASKLTGYHAPRVLAILSEAQAVEDFGWEGLMANATGPEDRILAVGNPLAPGTRFHQASRSRRWHTIRIPAAEHPNVREGRTVIPGGPSPAFVERMAKEWGRDSGQYVARVEARFPETATDSLVRQHWLRAAVERHEGRAFERDLKREYHTVAVDVARFGRDASVMCVRRGRHICGFDSWRGQDTQEVAVRVHDALAAIHDGGKSPVETVVVDTVGVGAGVADRLRKLLPRLEWYEAGRRGQGLRSRQPTLLEFNAGARAEDADRFANIKSETFWHLRTLLEESEIALPDDPMLLEELRQTRVETTADGRIKVEAKDRTRARLGGDSPDRADALTMSLLPELETSKARRVMWR